MWQPTHHILSLVGTGNVDKAAIFNKEGSSVWATSQGFTVRRSPDLGMLGLRNKSGGLKRSTRSHPPR